MQYSILKTIIETSLGQFACQTCANQLHIDHLAIRSISETSVDLDLRCPGCDSHTLMHAEIGQPHGGGFVPTGADTHEIKKIIAKNDNAIKPTDIAHIEQTLKSGNSIEDLLR